MIPSWAMQLPINLINAKGKTFDVDPAIIMAIVWAESSGSVYAVRYEPNYRWTYKPEKYHKRLGIDLKTETNLQKQSYGLCQIMGATARWLGYDGALPALYKPENNLYWGTKYLSYLKGKYTDNASVFAAYNKGNARKNPDGKFSNQGYVDKVFLSYNELKQA